MLEEIALDTPVPIDTIAITDEMPITIPSIVRPERTLFAERAVYVSCRVSLSVMVGMLSSAILFIRQYLAVSESDDALSVGCYIGLVSNENDTASMFAVELLKGTEHYLSCFGVEVTGRL